MKKSRILIPLILLIVSTLKAQEWDDPVTASDWNQIWRSSFIQSDNATNAPESSGWFWGINMNHSSNSSSYRYNGQIAIKNDNDSPTMYFRSTNSNGSGVWAKTVNMRSSSIGTLTTINSLRIHGNNLHGDDLTFMNNSGSMLVGWNRSASHGETDFISNRGVGPIGGFEFRDIDNSGSEKLLLKLKGSGEIGIGSSNPQSTLTIGDIVSTTISTKGIVLGSGNKSIELLHSPSSSGYGSKIYGVDEYNSTTSLRFAVRGNSSTWTDAVYINAGSTEKLGNVGIGTNDPDSKLTVAGNIHSREVKVTVNAGADFVFEKSYKLRTLEETEKFISQNKHLPEIASENEMIENGLQVGEMNIKLLQKIEELTLYLIEQNKKIEELTGKVQRLENQ